jgi:hypothetical protein
MRFILILILTIAVLFAVSIGFIYLNSKPNTFSDKEKEEAIGKMLGRKANLNPDIKTGNVTYNGDYVQFSYPASGQVYEYKSEGLKNNKNLLESFSFDMQNPRRILNYTVFKTNSSKIEDIPAVKLRKDKSNGYKEEDENINGVGGLSFSKDRNGEYLAEKSLFVLLNGNIYSISITGSSLDDVKELYNSIIGSLSFSN